MCGKLQGFSLRSNVRKCAKAKTPEKLAGVAGLEPVTSAVTGQRSNQLSYTPASGANERMENGVHSQMLIPSGAGFRIRKSKMNVWKGFSAHG